MGMHVHNPRDLVLAGWCRVAPVVQDHFVLRHKIDELAKRNFDGRNVETLVVVGLIEAEVERVNEARFGTRALNDCQFAIKEETEGKLLVACPLGVVNLQLSG